MSTTTASTSIDIVQLELTTAQLKSSICQQIDEYLELIKKHLETNDGQNDLDSSRTTTSSVSIEIINVDEEDDAEDAIPLNLSFRELPHFDSQLEHVVITATNNRSKSADILVKSGKQKTAKQQQQQVRKKCKKICKKTKPPTRTTKSTHPISISTSPSTSQSSSHARRCSYRRQTLPATTTSFPSRETNPPPPQQLTTQIIKIPPIINQSNSSSAAVQSTVTQSKLIPTHTSKSQPLSNDLVAISKTTTNRPSSKAACRSKRKTITTTSGIECTRKQPTVKKKSAKPSLTITRNSLRNASLFKPKRLCIRESSPEESGREESSVVVLENVATESMQFTTVAASNVDASLDLVHSNVFNNEIIPASSIETVPVPAQRQEPNESDRDFEDLRSQIESPPIAPPPPPSTPMTPRGSQTPFQLTIHPNSAFTPLRAVLVPVFDPEAAATRDTSTVQNTPQSPKPNEYPSAISPAQPILNVPNTQLNESTSPPRSPYSPDPTPEQSLTIKQEIVENTIEHRVQQQQLQQQQSESPFDIISSESEAELATELPVLLHQDIQSTSSPLAMHFSPISSPEPSNEPPQPYIPPIIIPCTTPPAVDFTPTPPPSILNIEHCTSPISSQTQSDLEFSVVPNFEVTEESAAATIEPITSPISSTQTQSDVELTVVPTSATKQILPIKLEISEELNAIPMQLENVNSLPDVSSSISPPTSITNVPIKQEISEEEVEVVQMNSIPVEQQPHLSPISSPDRSEMGTTTQVMTLQSVVPVSQYNNTTADICSWNFTEGSSTPLMLSNQTEFVEELALTTNEVMPEEMNSTISFSPSNAPPPASSSPPITFDLAQIKALLASLTAAATPLQDESSISTEESESLNIKQEIVHENCTATPVKIPVQCSQSSTDSPVLDDIEMEEGEIDDDIIIYETSPKTPEVVTQSTSNGTIEEDGELEKEPELEEGELIDSEEEEKAPEVVVRKEAKHRRRTKGRRQIQSDDDDSDYYYRHRHSSRRYRSKSPKKQSRRRQTRTSKKVSKQSPSPPSDGTIGVIVGNRDTKATATSATRDDHSTEHQDDHHTLSKRFIEQVPLIFDWSKGEEEGEANHTWGMFRTVYLGCYIEGCPEYFRKPHQLNEHLHAEHFMGIHFCPLEDCGRGFIKRSILKLHVETEHAGLIEWKCANCPEVFHFPELLQKHFYFFHSPGLFICGRSEVGCRFKGQLRCTVERHYRNYHLRKNVVDAEDVLGQIIKFTPSALKCTDCELWCLTEKALQKHLLEMHDIQRHRCYLVGCGMSFKMRDELHFHILKAHDDCRRWRCPQCTGVFYRNDFLKRHIELVHQEGYYSCTRCPFMAKYRKDAHKHWAREHEKRNGKSSEEEDEEEAEEETSEMSLLD